jgi:hypothetical protein
VVIEDPSNPNLLFAGNDAGVYVSIDGAGSWQSIRGNMPLVPVHDLQVHPREKDLIVGTYGRGIWITDISFLQELDATVLSKPIHLFAVESKYNRVPRNLGGNYQLYGSSHIRVPNEPNGLVINFYSREDGKDSASVSISDENNKVLFQRKIQPVRGLNSVVWNFNAGRTGSQNDMNLKPGALLITLDAAGQKFTTRTEFKGIKGWPVHD